MSIGLLSATSPTQTFGAKSTTKDFRFRPVTASLRPLVTCGLTSFPGSIYWIGLPRQGRSLRLRVSSNRARKSTRHQPGFRDAKSFLLGSASAVQIHHACTKPNHCGQAKSSHIDEANKQLAGSKLVGFLGKRKASVPRKSRKPSSQSV